MEEFKKYKQNRKLVEVTCDFCGEKFMKPESEYKRNIKLGRHNFCSRSCSMKFGNKTRSDKQSDWSNNPKNIENLINLNKSRVKEISFAYILRCAKKRFKDFNLNEEYLLEIWEKQNHKCPYTGLELILPTYSNVNTLDIETRASLDRIDSTKGYIIGNVQFVSTPINYLKNTMSDIQTKKFLKTISEFTSTFVEDQTISSSQ